MPASQQTFPVSSVSSGMPRTVLMDFQDDVLHDEAWALSQPAGVAPFTFTSFKDGPGVPTAGSPYLGVGEGRNGTNAMAIEMGTGLPGFWLMRAEGGGGLARPIGQEKFFDFGSTHNALEVVMRFPPGYRNQLSSQMPREWPNHENFQVGTYQAENLNNTEVEDNNWHYYYQIWLRHDVAQGDWFTVRVGIPQLGYGPTWQRSGIITTPPSNFWGQMTRFYIEDVPYNDSPQISTPYTVYVDSVSLVTVANPIWQDVAGDIYKLMTSDDNVERRWYSEVLPQ